MIICIKKSRIWIGFLLSLLIFTNQKSFQAKKPIYQLTTDKNHICYLPLQAGPDILLLFSANWRGVQPHSLKTYLYWYTKFKAQAKSCTVLACPIFLLVQSLNFLQHSREFLEIYCLASAVLIRHKKRIFLKA